MYYTPYSTPYTPQIDVPWKGPAIPLPIIRRRKKEEAEEEEEPRPLEWPLIIPPNDDDGKPTIH